MLETLRKKFGTYDKTCSVTKIYDGCVTFVRNEKYLPYLRFVKENIWVIAHPSFEKKIREYQSNGATAVNVHYSEWPEYEFTLYHNYLHKGKRQSAPCIGERCKIHPTAILDVDGVKVVNGPGREKVHFIHSGHILIGDDVHIGPYTVVHRGTMEMTNIQGGCKIGALNNIGHNCNIGTNSVVAAHVTFNGGVYTGSDCWFGSGSVIKHYTTIQDNVVIGHGAVVTKDIKESGIYVGNPAKFLKPVEEGWNF